MTRTEDVRAGVPRTAQRRNQREPTLNGLGKARGVPPLLSPCDDGGNVDGGRWLGIVKREHQGGRPAWGSPRQRLAGVGSDEFSNSIIYTRSPPTIHQTKHQTTLNHPKFKIVRTDALKPLPSLLRDHKASATNASKVTIAHQTKIDPKVSGGINYLDAFAAEQWLQELAEFEVGNQSDRFSRNVVSN